jgi:hypothetical protein
LAIVLPYLIDMDDRAKQRIDEQEWRKLCQQVAAEPDPERLSQLMDQLIKELDARREALRENEK